MQVERRFHNETDGYRYGFQGQERDDELKGEGNSLNYTFRMHDPRVGRFLSRDPLFQGYPDLSPYQFAGNSPIANVDLDGLERYFAADGTYLGQSKNGGNEIRIATTYNVYTKVDANGKRENGHVISASKSIPDVSFDTAGKVYATIYNREVKNENNSVQPSTFKAENNPRTTLSAYASPDKSITMNTNAIGSGQYIMTDYYNAANTLFHEGKHVKGIGSTPLEHFEIWKMQVNDETYKNTTSQYKSYINRLGKGYIEQMMAHVREAYGYKDYKTPEDKTYTVNYYYEIYKKSVEEYNKATNSNEEVLSKEYFEKYIENMAKSVIEKRKKKG